MGEPEAQYFVGGQAIAYAAQGNARRGELTQLLPRVRLNHLVHGQAVCVISAIAHRNLCRDGNSRKRPSESVTCIFSNHASNSGARLRPMTARRYNASWKEVLW